MVAIVSGSAAGLLNSSWGLRQVGNGRQGTTGENVVVNAATGNLVVQRRDELLRAAGLDAGLLRTYDSQGQFTDDNGDNWRLGLSRTIQNLTGAVSTVGSTVTRRAEDGSLALYSWDAAAALYRTHDGDGASDTLRFDGANWIWRDGDSQATERYASHAAGGKLLSASDRNGSVLALSYTGALLTQLLTASGERITFVYDSRAGATANLIEVRTEYRNAATDTLYQTLTRVRYAYDAANRLSSVTLDLTPNDNSIADNKTYLTRYTYDGSSQRLASIVQTDGSEVRFAYDTQLRVTSVTDVRSATDLRITRFDYGQPNQTRITNALGQVTTLTYDAAKRLTGISEPGSGTVSYVYDANGNVSRAVDGRGNAVIYTYDASDNRSSERDAAGNMVTRTFNGANQLLTQTTYRVPDPDGSGPLQATLPQTTSFFYNASGNLIYQISAEGRVTELRRDAQGRETSRITYLDGALDAVTTPLSVADVASWINGRLRQNAQRTDTAYDFRGQVQRTSTYAALGPAGEGVRDGSQSDTWFVYDQAGQLLKTVDARGMASTAIANDFVTSYAYDGLGRLLAASSTDGAGTAVTLSSTSYADAARQSIVQMASGLVTTTTFDQAGQAVSVVRNDSTRAGIEIARSTYEYDALNRQVAERITTTTGSQLSRYTIYDSAGRPAARIDASGAMVETVYDSNGAVTRTIAYTDPVAAGVLAAANAGSAGAAARLTLAQLRPAGNVAADRIVRQIVDAANRPVRSIAADGAVVDTVYDGAGRIIATISRANRLSVAQLAALAALEAGNTAILPADANATPVASAESDRMTRFYYNRDGDQTGQLDAEGLLTEIRYDMAGRKTHSIRYQTPTAVDKRASAVSIEQIRPAANAGDVVVASYLYDAAGRLTGERNAVNQLTEYRYDAAGNLALTLRYLSPSTVAIVNGMSVASLRPTGSYQSTARQYDAFNRVVREESQPDGLITTWRYDTAGNLIDRTSLPGPAQRQNLSRYDVLGRVTAELSPANAARIVAGMTQPQSDGIWQQYAVKHNYDQAGRRISTVDELGRKTLFYYDRENRLALTVDAAGETRQTLFDRFGQATETRTYKALLNATALATLAGGAMDNPALAAAMPAIGAQGFQAVRNTFNLRGQIATALDALGRRYVASYDAFGAVQQEQSDITSTQQLVNRYTYDRRGLLLTKSSDATGAAGSQATQQTSYDAFGRVEKSISETGVERRYSYDKLGRAIGIAGDQTRSMAYDLFNRVISSTENGSTTSTSYNDALRAMTVTMPTGARVTTTRNELGAVLTVVDASGSTTRYQYDRNGAVTSVTDAAGTSTTSYDARGRIASTTDRAGTVTVLAYDAADHLLTRTVDTGGLNLTEAWQYPDATGSTIWHRQPNGVWTRSDYDAAGRVVAIEVDPKRSPVWTSGADDNPAGLALKTLTTYDLAGHTVSVTEGAGSAAQRTTAYSYDARGRRLSETVDPAGLKLTTRYAYDKAGNLLRKTDAGGNASYYGYDEQDRLSVTIDPTGAVTRTRYDASDRVVGIDRFSTPVSAADLAAVAQASLGAPESMRRDSALLARLPADAQTRLLSTQTLYDADGRRRYNIDAAGTAEKFDYDAAGRVVARTLFANPVSATLQAAIRTGIASSGNSASGISALDAALLPDATRDQSRYDSYDAAGRLAFEVNAQREVTRHLYDAGSREVRELRYATRLAGAGLPTAAQLQALVTSSADSVVDKAYDQAGRLVFEIDNGVVTRYAYNALGARTGSTIYGMTLAPAATPMTLAQLNVQASSLLARTPADPVPVTLTWSYDRAGRLVESRDGMNIATLYSLDEMGRTLGMTVANGSPDASTTRYVWDKAGRLLEQSIAWGSAAVSTTRYAYDAMGNRISETDGRGIELAESDSDWALAQRKSLGYTQANGAARLRASLSAAEANALLRLYTSTSLFDALGRKTAATDALGNTTRSEYDAFGNLVKLTDPRGNAANFYYDAANRRVLSVNPEGDATRSEYRFDGELVKTTAYAGRITVPREVKNAPAIPIDPQNDRVTTYLFDKEARQVQVIDAMGFDELRSYDAMGRLVTLRNKLGGVTSYAYDARGLLVSETLPVTSANAAGVQVAVVNLYTYDARGNRIGSIEASGLPEQRTTTFAYDLANRLIEKRGQEFEVKTFNGFLQTSTKKTPREVYLYDARGNRSATIIGDARRTDTYYDAANRKTAEVSAEGALTSWTYDAAGNSIGKTAYAIALNRPGSAAAAPTPVSNDNARTIHYRFNANNVLVGTSETADYIYSKSGGVVMNATLTTTDILNANGQVIQSIDANGNAKYSFYDRVGNRLMQIDAEGYGVAWEYNSGGQIIRERRYASALSATTLAKLTTGSDVNALKLWYASAAQAGNDRISELRYDRAGQNIEEKILNVAYGAVDATTGALTSSTTAAITSYQYNGLGQIVQKIDANGNIYDTTYDVSGREIVRRSAAYIDQDGVTVRPTDSSSYDGLGHLKTSIKQGKDAADQRKTQYGYDINGVKISEIDAQGNPTYYTVNEFGEVIQKSGAVNRLSFPGSQTYEYDRMGRLTKQVDQGTGRRDGTVYNAFGEISFKSVNGINGEKTEYNKQGLVWRSNAGDGATRVTVYDAVGNATINIESAGTDLSGMSLETMIGIVNKNGELDAGGNAVPTPPAPVLVHATISVHDRRNQITDVIEPRMVTTHQDAGVQSIPVEVAQDVFQTGQIAVSAGQITSTDRWLYDLSNNHLLSMITLNLPDLSAWGAGNVLVHLQISSQDFYYQFPAGQSTIILPALWIGYVGHGSDEWYNNTYKLAYPSYTGVTITIDKQVNSAIQRLGTLTRSYPAGISSANEDWFPYSSTILEYDGTSSFENNAELTGTSIDVPQYLIFNGQPPQSTGLVFKYRPVGSTGAYTEMNVAAEYVSGVRIDGAFALPITSIPAGRQEFIYEARADNGLTILNRVAGIVNVQGSYSVIETQQQATVTKFITQLGWILRGTLSADSQIHRGQRHNAFGEIETETDGFDRSTDFSYNTLGKLIRKVDPQTSVTLENGFITRSRPETIYAYDLIGQNIAIRDANGNLNAMRYLPGSSENPQLVQEYHADGGKKRYDYDAFGQVRTITDELGAATRNSYDRNGNLTKVDRDGSNDDTYEYDAYGNRTAHVNGLNYRETWAYDSLGRVITSTSFAGRTTRTSYVWQAGITGLSGAAAMGGYTKTVTDANGRNQTTTTDIFGRIRSGSDLGGHVTSYSYNAAGWLMTQTSTAGQNLTYKYFYNGYVSEIADNTSNSLTKYEYDKAGNRIFEGYTSITSVYGNSADGRQFYQYANIQYDELNRVKSILDAKYRIDYEYDAASNRRRVLSSYHNGIGGNRTTQDYWYRYDSMNRFTLTKGALLNGRAASATAAPTLNKGRDGVELRYDLASQRISAVYADHSESYQYQYGALTSTYINGAIRARRENLGNRMHYVEYDADGSLRTDSTYTYDQDNKLLVDNNNLNNHGTNYHYLADGTLNDTVTYGDPTSTTTTYSYEWWDSAKQKDIQVQASNASAPAWRPGFSSMSYDVNGNLKEARDLAGDRALRYISNGEGLILSRSEIVNNAVGKNHSWYYANGRQVGDVGDDGQSVYDYAQELAQDKGLTTKEINQRYKPAAVANFDQNYQPVSSTYPALTAGSYTVKAGDTLRSVALAVWGDASLWYMIADANGLDSTSKLVDGVTLVIPNKVANIHNNSETFKVYDPGEKIGNTSPTLPEPPPPPATGKGGCGLKQLIIAVVAVVAAVYTAGALAAGTLNFSTAIGVGTGTITTVGGTAVSVGAGSLAAGAAAGSIASQTAAIAFGLQDKFSWKQVAVATLSSGISYGVDKILPTVDAFGKGATAVALRSASSSALTQGIDVVTGLQKRFDWRGVAGEAIGAGVSQELGKKFSAEQSRFWGGLAASLATNRGKLSASAIGSYIGGMAIETTLKRSISNPASSVNYPDGWDVQSDLADEDRRGQEWITQNDDIMAGRDSATNGGRTAEPLVDSDNYDLMGTSRKVGVVGKDGARGAWSIAQSLAGANATNAEVNHVKNQLLTLNPELANGSQNGQRYYLPDQDTVENLTLARVADQQYKTNFAVRQDPETGEPTWSFRQASLAARKLDDAMVLAEHNARLANAPGMSPWVEIKPDAAVPAYKVVTSALGMVTDGVGTLQGIAITNTGAALIAIPEPTVSKAAGILLTTYGATFTAKSVVGFGLNATNLMTALKGSTLEADYFAGSALETLVRNKGGSSDDQRIAVAADMAWGFSTGRFLDARVATGAVNSSRIASLLQVPTWTTAERQSALVAPATWRMVTRIEPGTSRLDISAKKYENILLPLFPSTTATGQ